MVNISGLNLNDLQDQTVFTLALFNDILQIDVGNTNNFVQKKIDEIFEQNVEFQYFVEKSIDHSYKLSNNAKDFTVFAKNFDDVNNEERLKYLRQFLIDTKSYQDESIKLKEQVTNIKN